MSGETVKEQAQNGVRSYANVTITERQSGKKFHSVLVLITYVEIIDSLSTQFPILTMEFLIEGKSDKGIRDQRYESLTRINV